MKGGKGVLSFGETTAYGSLNNAQPRVTSFQIFVWQCVKSKSS